MTLSQYIDILLDLETKICSESEINTGRADIEVITPAGKEPKISLAKNKETGVVEKIILK